MRGAMKSESEWMGKSEGRKGEGGGRRRERRRRTCDGRVRQDKVPRVVGANGRGEWRAEVPSNGVKVADVQTRQRCEEWRADVGGFEGGMREGKARRRVGQWEERMQYPIERKDAQGRVQLLCPTVVVSSAHSTRTASPNTRQHASRVSADWCQAPSADPPTVHILPRRRSGDEADR